MWRLRFLCVMVGIVVASVLVGCDDPMGDALELEKNGDWEGALVIYERVLADDADDLGALSGMATGLWLSGRYDEALRYQERVVAANPQDLETTLELAFNYLNHQDLASKAVVVLEHAVTLEDSGRVLVYLGLAKREAGDLEGAEDAFRRAIEMDASYGYAYHELVRLLEQQGRTEEVALTIKAARDNGVDLTETE